MSKTRGNTIDPLVVTEQYGTDAVRMALLTAAAPGTDIVFTQERMESSRAFANKIWNAARFLFMNMERSGVEPWTPEHPEAFVPDAEPDTMEVALEDLWIFSRLNSCAEQVNRAIAQHRYHEVAQTLWHFVWDDFCDWYIELKKLRFRENSGLNSDWRNILAAFEAMLRLLHPAMPFLTEELWQRLGEKSEGRPVSIALAAYPQYNAANTHLAAEHEMETLQSMIGVARNLRAEMKVDPKLSLSGTIYSRGDAQKTALVHALAVQKLANVKLEWGGEAAPANAGAMRSTPEFDLVLHLPAAQADAQRGRLEKERDQLEKVIANSHRQLSDEAFVSRAPEKVVTSIRQKLTEYETQIEKVRAALNQNAS